MLNFLVFVFCYIGGFALALLSQPVWAFMLYQMVYFMNPLERWWSYLVPNLSYSFFTVVLLLFVYIKKFKDHNLNRLFAAPPYKWALLFLFSFFLAKYYADLPDAHDFAFTNLFKLIIIISIAYKVVDSDKKLDRILYAYMAGATYLSFMVYQVGRNSGDRVEGVGTVDSPDTNDVAAALAPTLILAVYYFWQHTKKSVRFFVLVGAAFVANAIVLINSRGSFLAVICGAAYFFMHAIFSKHRQKNQRASAIGLIFMGLLALPFLVDESTIQRFMTIKTQEVTEEEETGATRVFFWLAAMEMAKDYPFGAGANGFTLHAPDYIPLEVNSGGSRNRAVHSSWFEALTEVGYPGLFFMIMMVISVFGVLKQCRKQVLSTGNIDLYFKLIALEGAFIAFLVGMTFLNRSRAEVFYWMVLFACCAYNVYVVRGRYGANDPLVATPQTPQSAQENR